MSVRQTEIAVIGGGPAGLQAAMTIGRVHRDAVVFDSGVYRNATVEHMHNVAGFDGTAPAEFRRQARAQVEEYRTIDFESTPVTELLAVGTPERPAFEVRLENGDVVEAGAVVLATGVRDELPAIPGLDEVWGTLAAQCPFCHGHEFSGGTVAMLGAAAAPHLGLWLHRIVDELVVLADGQPVADESRVALDTMKARIVPEHVERIERLDDGLGVHLDGGSEVSVDGIFVVPVLHQRAPFAHQLGLELNSSGCVRVDAFGQTSVRGVYAAGDMAHLPDFPMPQASVIQSLAAGQTAASTAMRG